MALQRFVHPRLCNNFLLPLTFLQNHLKGTKGINKSPTIEFEDVLDNFTTELLQKKIDSWEMKREKYKTQGSSFSGKVPNVDVKTLSKRQLSDVFNSALNECNDIFVIKLVEECLLHSICPNQDFILQILYICAQNGKINFIEDLKMLCDKESLAFSSNFDFLLYEAHATWKRGNVIKALEVFETLYIKNPFLRRHIKVLVKRLVIEGRKDNSEAIMLHIIKFSENIVSKYKDYYLMIFVWEICFMSEWFSDQQIALELLCNNKRLATMLGRRLPNIIHLSLQNHRLEAVYRLLEILLDFEMKEHYTLVVMALLDYQFLQRNLRSYCEIIKWCRHKDVNLPSVYSQKYFKLLFNKNEPKSQETLPDNKKNDYKFVF